MIRHTGSSPGCQVGLEHGPACLTARLTPRWRYRTKRNHRRQVWNCNSSCASASGAHRSLPSPLPQPEGRTRSTRCLTKGLSGLPVQHAGMSQAQRPRHGDDSKPWNGLWNNKQYLPFKAKRASQFASSRQRAREVCCAARCAVKNPNKMFDYCQRGGIRGVLACREGMRLVATGNIS